MWGQQQVGSLFSLARLPAPSLQEASLISQPDVSLLLLSPGTLAIGTMGWWWGGGGGFCCVPLPWAQAYVSPLTVAQREGAVFSLHRQAQGPVCRVLPQF